MNSKMKKIAIIIIFLITIFNVNVVNADDMIGIMKVYKIDINLINVDTTEYVIELIDGISNRVYETQNGNEQGHHNFAIATDMDERHLVNYSVKLKFKNGDIKDFGNIKLEDLIKIDEESNKSTFSYKYDLRVKLLPNIAIKIIIAIILIILAVFVIRAIKKHKKRII